jgi:hypothetical protein
MELKTFSELIEERQEHWIIRGVESEVTIGPAREMAAMWLRLKFGAGSGEIILWNTGEAEMSWTPDGESFGQEHYDITSETGLKGCLDDLEIRIGM